MRKTLTLSAALALVMVMMLAGCGTNTPTSTPTPSQSPAATPTASATLPPPSSSPQALAKVFTVTLALASGESPQVGRTAPGFKFTDADGNTVNLSDFRGKPVMLNFWNIACQPCFEEMPYLQEIYDEWTDKGLVFLSIDVGDRVNSVIGYVQRNKLSFPVLVDGSGEVALGYNVLSFPISILIDADGNISIIKIGAFANPQQIETSFLSLLFPEGT